MSSVIQDIESSQLRGDIPDFDPGDRVRVHFLVIEGNRKRPQVFEGVVIRRQGSGARETFTVRKQSFGVGVERTFPVHSPKIEKLEVASRGAVRRAKLYYLRGRTGKAARVAERRWGIDEEVIGAGAAGAVDASGESLPPEESVVAEVADGDETGTTEAVAEDQSTSDQPAEGSSEAEVDPGEGDSQEDAEPETETGETGESSEAPEEPPPEEPAPEESAPDVEEGTAQDTEQGESAESPEGDDDSTGDRDGA